MISLLVKFLAFLAIAAQCEAATLPTRVQHSVRALPTTNAEKVADALRAGPKFITDNATVVDWPSEEDLNTWPILRNGTSEWTCLPAPIPGTYRDFPACADAIFFKYVRDSVAKRPLQIDGIGVSYMLQGDDVALIGGGLYHLAPHIMIVTPHQEDLAVFPALPHNGSYINHLYDSTWFLVVPVGEVVLD